MPEPYLGVAFSDLLQEYLLISLIVFPLYITRFLDAEIHYGLEKPK